MDPADSSPEPFADSALRAELLATLAAGLLVAVAFLWAAPPLVDDAYIALCYARTLVEHGDWGVFPGSPTNTATSPLNVLLLAALGGPTDFYPQAARLLAALSFTLAGGCVGVVCRRRLGVSWMGAATVVLLACNPLLLSTLGLESPLTVGLLALVVFGLAEGRSVLLGAALGLAILARPDAVLLVPPVVWLGRDRGLRWSRVSLAAGAVLVPWHLLAWTSLGGLIPDTYFLKTAQQWGDDLGFVDGIVLYGGRDPLAVGASLVAAPFALLALRAPSDVRVGAALSVAFAVLTFAAYAVLDPPPYHWYFAPQVAGLTIASCLGLAVVTRRTTAWLPAVALVAPLLLVGLLVQDSREDGVREPPIHSNFGVEASYRELAARLADLVPEGTPIHSCAELGTLCFLSRRHLVDEFSDAARTSEVIRRTSDGSLFAESLRQIVHTWRDLPSEPIESSWYLLQTFEPRDVPADTYRFRVRTEVSGTSHLLLRHAP